MEHVPIDTRMPKGQRKKIDDVEVPPIKSVGRKRTKGEAGTVSIVRPYKYTPELGRKIAEDVAAGATLQLAAAANLVGEVTIHNWINAGLSKNSPELEEFVAWIEQARAEFIVGGLKRLRQKALSADNNSWLAQAWLLERVPAGQPYSIQKTKVEVEDVTVKEAAAKIATVEAKVLQDRAEQLQLEGPDVADSPGQDEETEG